MKASRETIRRAYSSRTMGLATVRPECDSKRAAWSGKPLASIKMEAVPTSVEKCGSDR